MQHLKKVQALEVQELRNEMKSELHRERRVLERESEIAESHNQVALRKMRNELREKNDEISAVSRRMATN